MKKNIYKLIGIPAIVFSAVYFFQYIKATEFPSNDTKATEQQVVNVPASKTLESQVITVRSTTLED